MIQRNKINYHRILEKTVEENRALGVKPKLLLHCCCAPCSSYCLEYLNGKFDITCLFYNPNITDKDEYEKRLAELRSYVLRVFYGAFEIIDGGFGSEEFYGLAKGKENEPECGARCSACYELRLSKTFEQAKSGGYDYFATTLTVSPYKNAQMINEIGLRISENSSVKYLPSDFKKNGGYLRSIELSREYGLYRQNYCGCEFSKRAAEYKTADKFGGREAENNG